MKRMTAALLCLILILTVFTGCGSKDPLVGTWKLDMSLMEAFAANGIDLGSQFGNFSGNSRLQGVTLTFNEDGQVVTTASVTEITASVEAFLDEFFAYLNEGGLYDFFEASGVSREQIDNYMAMQGKSMEDFVTDMQEELAAGLDVTMLSEKLAKSFAQESVEKNQAGDYEMTEAYEVKEGVIVTAETEKNLEHGTGTRYQISEDGNTLTLTEDGVSMTFSKVSTGK